MSGFAITVPVVASNVSQLGALPMVSVGVGTPVASIVSVAVDPWATTRWGVVSVKAGVVSAVTVMSWVTGPPTPLSAVMRTVSVPGAVGEPVKVTTPATLSSKVMPGGNNAPSASGSVTVTVDVR